MTLSANEVKAGVIESHEAFGKLVAGLTDEEWATPTRCEGWTVGDVAAHVIGTMSDIVNGNVDALGQPGVTQRQVDERKGRSPGELADELQTAQPVAQSLLDAFDDEAWQSPAPGGYEGNLVQGVEALWYDAIVHAEDIRAAIGRTPETELKDVRACVHHVAFELEKRGWGPATLDLTGIEKIEIGGGGGQVVTGDPLTFVLVATGREDPSVIGLDASVDIYAE